MLRMPLTWLRSRALFGQLPVGLLLAGLMLAHGSALACTAAELHAAAYDRGALSAAEADSAAATSGTARMSLNQGPNQGLKLRTRHQDTVFQGHLPSTSLASPADPIQSSNPRTPRPAQAEESVSATSNKPLAMLAAALVVMVSIALRRSGKR